MTIVIRFLPQHGTIAHLHPPQQWIRKLSESLAA